MVPADRPVPWLVVDDEGVLIEPIRRYLNDFITRDTSVGVRTELWVRALRWWRWLGAVDVEWNHATSAETRDFVLWLKQAIKPRQSPPATAHGWSCRPRVPDPPVSANQLHLSFTPPNSLKNRLAAFPEEPRQPRTRSALGQPPPA